MTPIDRTDPVIMGHILSEHRELFEQLSTLRTMLATESPPGCERLRELVRAIDEAFVVERFMACGKTRDRGLVHEFGDDDAHGPTDSSRTGG